ncbi:hypothetical protein R5W23_000856 [Gemmata sp. JC673]|uniref:Uncharacterized protein n=1 Tax=Gemmata algarum TaxID=2975278 RepID=A0ABU5EUL5_9BACT|nr:hypothetical protein [Gemmata algarum]MDY3558135.1 hypothetical protein [Gemmata algarum]
MTIDKLIARLEWFKGQIGGDKQVKVVDGEGEWGFMLHGEMIEDPESETGMSTKLLIDLTGEPEE